MQFSAEGDLAAPAAIQEQKAWLSARTKLLFFQTPTQFLVLTELSTERS